MVLLTMLLIIIILCLFFFISKIYKNLYIKSINNSSRENKLPEYRQIQKYLILITSLLIIGTIIFFPTYYLNTFDKTSTMPTTTLTLVRKNVYYTNSEHKDGIYLTFYVESLEHQEVFGENIEIKVREENSDFAFKSAVLEHEYLVTMSYYGKYDSFLDAKANTTIYLVELIAHSQNYCQFYDDYKECETSYNND